MYGMYFSFVLFCIAIYCNLLWWRDYYYHFFTYIHVLFSINVFKRKKKKKKNANATVIPCRAQTETSRNYLHCCDVCLCQ